MTMNRTVGSNHSGLSTAVYRELSVARAMQQPTRNQIDATKKYHTITRTRNKRKQTQYLTKFDNFPMSSGQGGEILLI